MKQTSIIIPAFNEEKTLAFLLKQLTSVQRNVIIVDDGSTDKTYEIAKSMNYYIIRNDNNMGISYSILKGLYYAVKNGFTKAILLDADGQHETKYIAQFNKMLLNCDFVMGNRFYPGSFTPDLKRNSNILGAKIIDKIFNQNFTDVSCGFKGFHITPRLLQYLEKSVDFSIVFDLLLYTLQSKNNIGVVNMPAIYNPSQMYITRIKELESYIYALKRLNNIIFPANIHQTIDLIEASLKKQEDFQISIDGVDFYGFFVARAKGYIIQSNIIEKI